MRQFLMTRSVVAISARLGPVFTHASRPSDAIFEQCPKVSLRIAGELGGFERTLTLPIWVLLESGVVKALPPGG